MVSNFLFLHASIAEKHHLSSPTATKASHCQKPCWDQAILSSLVNKPVGTWLLLIICHALIDAPENLPNLEHFPLWGHF